MKPPMHRLETPTAVAAVAGNSAVPVLIVDDDPGKRLALKSVLSPLGYRIVEADSGAAALRCLMTQDFAVILMDVRMPVMDGFETAHLIRQRRQSELTPIIFITAYGSESIANLTAYATGAADFIFSPVPPPELRAKVAVFANLYLRAEFLAAQAREVQESADQLTLLTDAAPIGIFRMDTAGNYIYVNPRWAEITGISPAGAVGRPWHIIMTPELATELVTELATEMVDGGSAPAGSDARDFGFAQPFHIKQPAGLTSRIVHGSAKPILGSDDVTLGWVGTLSDVTVEAGAKAAMLVARDEALAAAVRQSSFATSASHELKTPTACILGFIEEVLENDLLSEDDRKCLDIAYRSAQRLSHLIDDLLILGEADISADRMQIEPTDVVSLTQAVLSTFASTAQHADLELVFDPTAFPEADSCRALADPLRLEQALTNLVSNAVKFTPRGGRVGVAITDDGDNVEIVVTDTGIGIDAVAIDSVFDRFYRAEEAILVGIKGSGLGLAIARQMIEAQGGRLDATSVVGQGSTFTIALPTAARQPA
jgi:hypothetical protein